MRGYWRIAKFTGIGIYVHWSFSLLLLWVLLRHAQQETTVAGAAVEIGFVLAVFACIILHEFGHALTARRFGVRTKHIRVLPIGCVAELERIPEDPWQELSIAIAGPLVTAAIAIVLAFVVQMLGTQASPVDAEGFALLMWCNVALLLFNLVPAFPMDGGRVLRAILAMKMDHLRATEVAVNVGQKIAMVFIILGLFYNFLLVFVGLFVYFSAGAERMFVRTHALTKGVPVRDAMVRRFFGVKQTAPLQEAITGLLDSTQIAFPIVNESGGVVGTLTRQQILKAARKTPRDTAVSYLMAPHQAAVEETATLDEVAKQMRPEIDLIPIVREGRLVGIVTPESLADWVAIHEIEASASKQSQSTTTSRVSEPNRKIKNRHNRVGASVSAVDRSARPSGV